MKKFNEEPPVYPTVKVERTEYSVQFKTVNPETKYKEYNCTQNPVGNVLTPTTWEIDGAMPNQKKKHLLVFHLLPQKASRQIQWEKSMSRDEAESFGHYKWDKRMRPKVQKFPPNGPECEELRILFVSYTI